MRFHPATIRQGQEGSLSRSVSALIQISAAALSIALSQVLIAQRANAQLVVGTTYNSNAYPFYAGYAGEYEQVYASAAFSGPVYISQIAFASAPGNTVPGTFSFTGTLSLGTTGATPTSIASTYAGNQRADLTTAFSGTETTTLLANNTFDLVFNVTPFLYNPAAGSLLLDITNTGAYNSSANSPLFDSGIVQSGDEPQMARLYNFGGNGTPTGEIESGLVTRFTVSAGSAASAPEPSALLFFLPTMSALGAFTARKRRLRSCLPFSGPKCL